MAGKYVRNAVETITTMLICRHTGRCTTEYYLSRMYVCLHVLQNNQLSANLLKMKQISTITKEIFYIVNKFFFTYIYTQNSICTIIFIHKWLKIPDSEATKKDMYSIAH